jgi:type II secretory pathway component GspD/PulD (secretin)
MVRIKSLFILLIFLSLSSLSLGLHAENMQLEIVPLQHRLSSDVIPILRPLLSEGGTLTGMNNQLIIKTDTENLGEIIRTLQTIDRPIRSLKISVRYDTKNEFRGREEGIDGSYRAGDVRVESRNPGSYADDGLIISSQGKDGDVRYRQWSTDSQNDNDSVYFVRTVEGQPAWIRSGESVPVADRTVVHHPYGTDVYDSVGYQEINSGFYVIPRLNGDRVTLMISPQQQRRNDSYGRYKSSGAETTISGMLGRWIELGGVDEHYQQQSGGTLYKTRSSGSDYQNIQVMVEELR